MEDCSAVAIGNRLVELRKRYSRDTKQRLTQAEFAKKLGFSREQVAKFETGRQPLTPDQVHLISRFYGITSDELICGIKAQNQTVASELGLSNDAIDFLRELAASDDDAAIPITWTDGWTDEEETDVTSPGFAMLGHHASVEAVYPSEIRTILNYLLSEGKGKSLLSAIYKYVTIDPSSAIASTENRNGLEKLSFPVYELLFSTSASNHSVSIDVWAMVYALKEVVSTILEDIRKEIQKEGR